MKKIAFLGGKPLGARCLEYLLSRNDIEVVAVVCRDRHIKGWWHNGDNKRVIDIVEEHNLNKVKEEELFSYDIDIAISVLFFNIITSEFITRCKNKVYNLHPAPLPYYRGSNSYSHAIINGEDAYGVTFHLVDEGIDTGPIIKVRWFEICPTMTARELHDKAQEEAFLLFKEQIPGIIKGDYIAISQNEILRNSNRKSYTYNKSSLKDLKKITVKDITERPDYVYNLVRALDFPPFESAYITIDNSKVYLRTGSSMAETMKRIVVL